MTEIPVELQRRLRRTRSEAEAALECARSEAAALRRALASLPVQDQADPAIQDLMRALDAGEQLREQAAGLLRSPLQGSPPS